MFVFINLTTKLSKNEEYNKFYVVFLYKTMNKISVNRKSA